MANLITTELARLGTAKAGLKQAIEDKGVAVSAEALLDDYPALVADIIVGEAPLGGYAEATLPEGNDGRYRFLTSTGELFVASSLSAIRGIWRLDRQANEFVQVYAIGNSWEYWFEDSQGNVFVSSLLSTGILRWNGTAFVTAYSDGQQWTHWYEDSQGRIFVGSDKNNGILRWNGTSSFIQVYQTGSWEYWFEDSQGNVFVGSAYMSNVEGILWFSGQEFNSVYSGGKYWEYWFEDRQGNVFVSGVFSAILRWNGIQFATAYSSRSGLEFWFEDSRGNVFVGGPEGGILFWNGTTFVKVYSIGDYWGHWFEDGQGNVFVSSIYSSGLGILRWNGTAFVSVFSTGYGWKYWFEDNQGKVFVSASTQAGLLHYDGVAFVSLNVGIKRHPRQFDHWINDAQIRLFACSSYNDVDNKGIYRWNGTTFIQVFKSDYGWVFSNENGVACAVSPHLAGHVRYNARTDTFVVVDANKTLQRFGPFLTVYADESTLCRILGDGKQVVLTRFYNPATLLENPAGDACMFSVDGAYVLYSLNA